jgi:pantothenate synthetase
MERWLELSKARLQDLSCLFERLCGFKTSTHHESVCGVISELLILNDVALCCQDSAGHGMNNAGLISTLQGSD